MEINSIAVGQRIKAIRLSIGKSMEEFGKNFNTSKGTVNNWEKGRNLPNKENLLKISEIGNTTPEYILYGSSNDYIDSKISRIEQSLLCDKSISNSIVPNIINNIKIKVEAYSNRLTTINEIDTELEKIKKESVEIWSTPKKIEANVINDLSHSLSNTIFNSMGYFYSDYYSNKSDSENKGDKITPISDEILKQLHSLEKIVNTYLDLVRYLDNNNVVDEEVRKELNEISEFVKKYSKIIW